MQKQNARLKRKKRIRATIGSHNIPRLTVFRSNTTLYVQIIDDSQGKTLVAKREKGKTKNTAIKLGAEVAKAAKIKHITKIVFDRNGYRYHGVIAALAQAIREGGLLF